MRLVSCSKVLVSMFSLVLFVMSCQSEEKAEFVQIGGMAQGTTYSIVYENTINEHLNVPISRLLSDFDSSLSNYEANSIISKINRNESVELDSLFISFFNLSAQIYAKTNGAFDITVAPLVNAWGFGWKQKVDPDSAMVDSLLQYVGMEKIKLSYGKVKKTNLNMQIVSNAIAQGQSVDMIAQFLDNKGIKNYLVEVGGELKMKGLNKKGEMWRVGIDKPVDSLSLDNRQLQSVVSVTDVAVATSGNYRKFYLKDGMKLSHTVDPRTGYPVSHSLLSVTVFANSCAEADALATAFMVMGVDATKAFVRKHSQYKCILMYAGENGKIVVEPTHKEIKIL